MDTDREPPKKCFCTRCFLPVEPEERVDIEGQNFHRICSMCCVCRSIPTSLKMFYGHVFCNECFKAHVMTRLRGENQRIHSNSWWMQWAPGAKPRESGSENKDDEENLPEAKPAESAEEQQPKRCICSRCLQAIDDNNKVDIAGQSFHKQCAKCYICHTVPTSNPKIYYGQVFCEECFHRHVLNRNKDNPSEFFKNCFDQWQNNAQFAENMKDFMTGNKDNVPFVFMMQGQQPPFCRCGTGPQEWFQNNEPKKSATPGTISIEKMSLDTYELSFENLTEVSEIPESSNNINESANQENSLVSASEKIEKLTKYFHELDITKDSEKLAKKWKNFYESDKTSLRSDCTPSCYGWVDYQDSRTSRTQFDCPKCLWQCGPIYVNSEYLQNVCSGDK